MSTVQSPARIKELTEERLELIEEKNKVTEELRALNTRINHSDIPEPERRIILNSLYARRAELVKESDELSADIADVNAEIKELSGSGKATWDMRNVLTIVAAYIAAGDTRPADEMTRHAIEELEIITRTVADYKP